MATSAGPSSGCAARRGPGSDTSVVRAPGYNGSGIPLHGEERDSSKKPKYHHDQELPVKEKVVTVEKCHSCANGLRQNKTSQKIHTDGPTAPQETHHPPPPWLSFCDRRHTCPSCIQIGLHPSLARKHTPHTPAESCYQPSRLQPVI